MRAFVRQGLAALLLPLILGGEAAAQEGPSLRPGARVRVWSALRGDQRPIVGTLVEFRPNVVAVVPIGSVFPVSFALADLTRFQVNVDRPPALRYGPLMLGAALGAWFGYAILAGDARCPEGVENPDCEWVTAPIVVGGAGGAILFSLAVDLMLPEFWREVRLDQLRANVMASGLGRVRLGLQLRFD